LQEQIITCSFTGALMIRNCLPARTWLIPLLFLASCQQRPGQPPAEAVQFIAIAGVPHVAGTNLPRWAACWFPHRANAGAVRRAQPCPAESVATTVYTPRDVQGCWLLMGEDGKPPYDSPSLSGPLRLDVEISPRLRAWNGEQAGSYDVRLPAHVPDSLSIDTVGFVTYWEFAPPDSLSIIRTMGLAGIQMSFRVRGDSLIGMGRGFWDVIEMSMDTTPDPVTSIRGRRVACPPADAGNAR
jgi:hypothetical protein